MVNIYSKLLSTARFRESSVTGRNVLLEAESDRGRLLFCPAFRRLQQKAQVFSMEPNAAVRSRLTHSLEVSQMGRYIADQVSIKLVDLGLATSQECAALTTFVETACLMHDIGNPPFGHFGESAIAEWFSIRGEGAIKKACWPESLAELDDGDVQLIRKTLADFLEFDGNPQGIRIVTKLQRNSDEFGLNLTKTTIASYLKYLRSSGVEDNGALFTKKCGYFSTEKNIIESVWEEFGYVSPQRFPLAYIMEAADDIAYCISDLEDSIEKGLLDEKSALSDVHIEWSNYSKSNDCENHEISRILKLAASGVREDRNEFTYIDFRTSLNRELVKFAVDQYVSSHSAVINGSLSSLISADSPAGAILDFLKSYCRKKVYCHEAVQQVELAGYRAIYGLLEHFSCLLEASENRFSCALDYSVKKDDSGRGIIIENKLLSLFPKNYIKVYKHEVNKLDRSAVGYKFLEWNLRAHLVVDFISGMTDDFAVKTYQTLSGMKI